MKNKFVKGLIAMGMAAGLTLAVTTPAEAFSSTRSCNWPQRSAIEFRTNPSANVNAYSHGGTFLGSKASSTPRTITWYTPWEDVRFVSSGYIAWYSTWCY